MNKNIINAVELPRIINVENNMYCAAFDLMKLLPARHMIENAVKDKLINKDTIIIETSSGTFALGLAMVCNLYKYKLIIVSDPVIDDSLRRRLEDLGTRVEIVDKEHPQKGFQGARLEKVNEFLKMYPNSFWTNQYDNHNNSDAYADVAELLVKEVGEIDAVIGSVGSGGSMSGVCKYLKKVFKDLYVIGVDTNGSVLFGQKNSSRQLRGLGNSIMPKNLDHTLFNEVHWIEAAHAYRETRLLHEQYALFMGGTSGAAFAVAKWYHHNNPEKRIVVLLPDKGYRYQDTIYNDQWLKDNGLWIDELPVSPNLVKTPREAQDQGGWNRMLWNNRPYEDVVKEN